MFLLLNLFNKDLLKIRVTHKEEFIEFFLSSIINKKNKNDFNEDNHFYLLNSYLDYKGEQFKDVYFNILKTAYMQLYEEERKRNFDDIPAYIIEPILNLITLEDVLKFIKTTNIIIPPKALCDEFIEAEDGENKNTRIQTYIKEDYIELVAMAVIIKATIGPICHYGYLMKNDINGLNICYVLIHFYKSHPFFDSPPMVKLLQVMEKLIFLPLDSKEDISTKVISNNLPEEELPLLMLSIVIIQKIALSSFTKENDDNNIVKTIYNYVKNKTKSEGDVSKNIKNKTAMVDADNSGDKESIIESHRLPCDLPKGFVVELNWSVSSTEAIIKQLPSSMLPYIDLELINQAKEFASKLNNFVVSQVQIDIISHVFKKIIDPRAIPYLKLENLLNLFCVGFSYLYKLNFKELAILLFSRIVQQDTNIYISTTNRTKIPKELKDELDVYFPYKRVISSSKIVNIAEESINLMTNELISNPWMPVVNEKILSELNGSCIQDKIVPGNIKIILANFYINVEKNLMGEGIK